MRKFACVPDCSDCCIYREYYPSEEFGKIGVLLLPEEKDRIERLAGEKGVSVKILPRLAVGDRPEKIIAYQMMGKENGDLCPFLDVTGDGRSPHGGYLCKIYKQRPLACSAYPVIGAGREATLDPHCQFCKKYSSRAGLEGLENELESLARIKGAVRSEGRRVWRYATAAGEKASRPEGWVLEP